MTASVFVSSVDGGVVRRFRMILGIAGILVGVEHLEISQRIEQSGCFFPRWPWLPELPLLVHRYAAILAMLTSLMTALNIVPRIAGFLTAIILAGSAIYDPRLFSNHTWLTAILMFVVSFAGTPRHAGGPYWPIWLCKVQFSLVYLFAALTKLNPDFLSGASLYLLFQAQGICFFESVPESYLPLVFSTMAFLAVTTELTLAVALWTTKLRQPAILIGIVFHAGLTASLPPDHRLGIIIFDVLFLGGYYLFLKGLPIDRDLAAGG